MYRTFLSLRIAMVHLVLSILQLPNYTITCMGDPIQSELLPMEIPLLTSYPRALTTASQIHLTSVRHKSDKLDEHSPDLLGQGYGYNETYKMNRVVCYEDPEDAACMPMDSSTPILGTY